MKITFVEKDSMLIFKKGKYWTATKPFKCEVKINKEMIKNRLFSQEMTSNEIIEFSPQIKEKCEKLSKISKDIEIIVETNNENIGKFATTNVNIIGFIENINNEQYISCFYDEDGESIIYLKRPNTM